MLTQEFLATLEWVHEYDYNTGDEPTIGFRLRNTYRTLTMTELRRVLCITKLSSDNFQGPTDENTFDFVGIIPGGLGNDGVKTPSLKSSN